tara:strand:+ start:192 stop:923 length:732 start_codon:yes stop_codon:yes gene_type:complete
MDTKVSLDMDKMSIDNIIYDEKKVKNNKIVIPIKYKEKNKITSLIVQTPTFRNIKILKTKKNNYELYIPLIGKKQKNINDFIDFIEKLEKKIIYDAQINSSSWFTEEKNIKLSYLKTINKRLPNDLELSTNSINIIDKSKGYFKIKIYNNTDNRTILQYDKKNIKLEEIPNDGWIKMILNFSCVIVSNNNFHIKLKPVIISFSPLDNLQKQNIVITKTQISNKSLDISDDDEITENSLTEFPN